MTGGNRVQNINPKNHLQLTVDKLPKTVLFPGDPDRVSEIAAFLTNVRQVGHHRNYITIIGNYAGSEIAACSSGMGGPSTEIAVVELKRYGVKNIIRIGTSGGIGKNVRPGDLIVLKSCIRFSGAADLFIPVNYPAVSDFITTIALEKAARKTGMNVYAGIGLSIDSFYATKPYLIGDNFPSAIEKDLPMWRDSGALQIDMEAATLFILSSLLDIRAGAICTVGSALLENLRPETPPSNKHAIIAACETALLLQNYENEREDIL
jgi:uridine phosphorylase